MAHLNFEEMTKPLTTRDIGQEIDPGFYGANIAERIGTAGIRERRSMREAFNDLGKRLNDIEAFIDEAITPNLMPILSNENPREVDPGNKIPTSGDSEMYLMIKELDNMGYRIRQKLSVLQSRIQL